ncbi:MAG: Aspartate racemase [uncultured Thermomicrobiales bacterium]|uniref:Aspartate racemase n=1 Tax=uncultured Thermomicrobiales bacterium TaxID=1645740 RepID=A0A6J4UJ98_9BACT|nr:MAG: Aspartate racemase [uncultured Thermomicrobiales bacterium]
MTRTVGIIGGMGPLATADLYRKLILATPARRDQDHLHVIIDADPTIPDRTAALRGEGPDPTPALLAAARRLEGAGADFLAIVCNTAHAFLPALRPQLAIPILDMIAETAGQIADSFPGMRRVGILATRGTIETGLYERALRERGLEALIPAPEQQRLVDAGIGAVKEGITGPAAGGWLAEASRALVASGAEVLVAGCTEIPLVLDAGMVPVPLIDPTHTLAEAAVREARAAPTKGTDGEGTGLSGRRAIIAAAK